MLLGICLGHDVVLEQPMTSLMFEHPRVRQLVKLGEVGAIRPLQFISTYMGSFGAETPKATVLLGTPAWLPNLRRCLQLKLHKKRHQTAAHFRGKDGGNKYRGNAALKSTQVYPIGYGKAIADSMQSAVVDADVSEDFDFQQLADFEHLQGSTALWLDAALMPVWRVVLALDA